MDFRYKPAIRVISLAVLFFFCWTFGGIFDIAYAVKSAEEQKSNSAEVKSKLKTLKSEEKFQKTIEDIEKTLADTDTKKNKIKTKKTEIESLDVEIKKQFDATERFLKEKGLPPEILERHRNFVKHYEDNLNELKSNLDEIQKHSAKSKELSDAIDKTKKFLEKVKPKKKHTPLDPNKLPHRTAEPVWKEPRTSPDQFKEEQTAGYKNIYKIHDARYTIKNKSRVDHASDIMNRGSVLVASTGSLTGLLDSSLPDAYEQPILLAQASNPPTSADLAETIEIKFTPAIQAKAQELGNNPIKIYEYVRNNFEYEPYYGSLKGAQQTLLEKTGNDFDQASLLIALLRVSNIPARYVYGTVEIPIEKIMNWVGGVTDPNTAAQILATAGVPGKLLTEGGKIKYAQMEHVWVEAYVPYGNYRGAMRDDSIKTWIPLDPSFKQYDYKRGMDLYTAVAINGETYIQDYITDTSPSPVPLELQQLFPDYAISPYQYYSRRLLNYIDNNFPDSTTEDIIGDETIALTKTIIKKEYPYLLGSLPYKVVTRGATYSAIPNNLRPSISFTIENPLTYEIDLSYNITLPEISGKRITLSYIPATSADEVLIAKYGGLLNVPPYLLNVKPVVKANGITVATGVPIGLGYDQTFNMTFRIPNKGVDVVTNKVTAGDYSAIAIQYYKTPSNLVADKMETLTGNIGSTDLDDLLGQMLYNIGLSYFHHLTFEEELYAKNFQMVITKEPSEAIVTSQAITEYLWGVPFRVTEGGVAIDVDRNISASFSIDGSQQRKKDFMIVSGLGSSAWEDMILQSFFNIPSVSASRLLKIANQRGIPIYTIDSGNINTILPQLQVTSDVTDNIRNAVNAGKKVIVSKTNVQYNDWNGAGYIILDPVKGSGAYLISGGLAGSETSKKASVSLRNPSDCSALITSFTRQAVIQIALANLDTPYVWGGEDPVCGFDCSGFINYVFYVVYGGTAFPIRINKKGQIERLTAEGLYQYCKQKNWLYPFEEVLEGDIIWRINAELQHTHVGIYYLLFKAIHALGRPCKDGELPPVPPECGNDADAKQRICGKYRSVVITSLDIFKGSGQIDSYVCRPQP